MTCAVCYQSCAGGLTACIQGAVVCNRCITQLFERAAKNECDYPVKWAGRILEIEQYRLLLPSELYQNFKVREQEYQCPVPERVFCEGFRRASNQPQGFERCNNFLGKVLAITGGANTCITCEQCQALSCLCCKRVVGGPLHACSVSRPTGSLLGAFDGLTRGKDYQICPSKRCQRKIQLIDGCNHIHCVCGTEFCFICGEQAEDESDHWVNQPGLPSCPRYNQPGSGNAHYDPDEVVRQQRYTPSMLHMMQQQQQQRIWLQRIAARNAVNNELPNPEVAHMRDPQLRTLQMLQRIHQRLQQLPADDAATRTRLLQLQAQTLAALNIPVRTTDPALVEQTQRQSNAQAHFPSVPPLYPQTLLPQVPRIFPRGDGEMLPRRRAHASVVGAQWPSGPAPTTMPPSTLVPTFNDYEARPARTNASFSEFRSGNEAYNVTRPPAQVLREPFLAGLAQDFPQGAPPLNDATNAGLFDMHQTLSGQPTNGYANPWSNQPRQPEFRHDLISPDAPFVSNPPLDSPASTPQYGYFSQPFFHPHLPPDNLRGAVNAFAPPLALGAEAARLDQTNSIFPSSMSPMTSHTGPQTHPWPQTDPNRVPTTTSTQGRPGPSVSHIPLRTTYIFGSGQSRIGGSSQ